MLTVDLLFPFAWGSAQTAQNPDPPKGKPVQTEAPDLDVPVKKADDTLDDLSDETEPSSTPEQDILLDADTWFKEWNAKPHSLAGLLHKVVFIKGFHPQTGEAELYDFAPAPFEALGFVVPVNSRAFQLYRNLNQRPTEVETHEQKSGADKDADSKDASKSSAKSPRGQFEGRDLATIGELLTTSGAGAAIVDQQSKWAVYQLKGGKPQKVFDFPAPKKKEIKDIHRALVRSLGYDAIILDRKGDHFLVASMALIPRDGLQALVLTDTQGLIHLKKADKKGAGLMELVTSSGKAQGIFKLIVGGGSGNEIPLGTKVILETGKSQKKGL